MKLVPKPYTLISAQCLVLKGCAAAPGPKELGGAPTTAAAAARAAAMATSPPAAGHQHQVQDVVNRSIKVRRTKLKPYQRCTSVYKHCKATRGLDHHAGSWFVSNISLFMHCWNRRKSDGDNKVNQLEVLHPRLLVDSLKAHICSRCNAYMMWWFRRRLPHCPGFRV